VPKPFARVALVLGAPIPIGRDGAAGALAAVQRALETTATEAAALVVRAPA